MQKMMTTQRRLCWWLALTLTACNTVTTNTVPDDEGSDSDEGGDVVDEIGESCKQFFACGEGPDGFTESSCRQMLIDCKASLGASQPGYFDGQVNACLDTATCDDFDACLFELIEACLGETDGCDPALDEPVCQGDEIGACVQGEWTSFSCSDVCAADDGFYYSCGFDEGREHDVCWCVRGDPDTCELGVTAICTCYECSPDEAQTLFEECVVQGSEVVTCFAGRVQGNQIDCAAAADACL